MAIVFSPDAKFALPRGYLRGIAIEIQWITSLAYAGDGLFIAHLIAPFAETDFYYQFAEWYLQPDARAVSFERILLDAYYWNIVYLDYRPLPTIAFTRASAEAGGFEIVLREPDYLVVDPIRYEFAPMPPDYWLPE